MKITIAPTHAPVSGQSANTVHCVVSVEHPYDDLDLVETMELVRQALLGYGFSEKVTSEYFDADL